MRKFIQIILSILLISSLFACDKTNNNSLINKMTLREKICQIIMPSFRYLEYQTIEEVDEEGNTISNIESIVLEEVNEKLRSFLEEYKFGGIILFSQNITSSKQTYNFINDLKKAHNSNYDIPLLIGIDQEGGNIKRVSYGTGMVGNMALAASNNPSNAYTSSKIMGEELKLLGINLNFAPVVDINSNPNNPIIGIRSFSDDPTYSKDYIIQSIKGYHDSNIATAIKHFPGHGDTSTDSHTGLPLVNKTLEEIKDFELKTFEIGIDNNTDMIMSAHIQFPNIDNTTYKTKDNKEIYLPATLSNKILSILRNDYKYNGVIISDSLVMDAINENFEKKDSAKLALEAGIDMLLMPIVYTQSLDSYIEELKDYVDMIEKMVIDKEIDEKLIDEKVERILKLKEDRNLFNEENNEVDYTSLIGSKENHDKELDIAKEAITLVENNNNTLPLNKDNKTLIMVPYSSQLNSIIFAKNILLEEKLINEETIEEYAYGDDTLDSFKQYLNNNIDNYDSLVIVSSMYSNDDSNEEYASIIDYALSISKEKEIKNILISSQLPYDLSRFDADGKVACYYAGGMTQIPTSYNEDVRNYGPNLPASFLLIFNETTFKGKLPVDIPDIKLEDNIYVLDTNNIKYKRGLGLN